MHELTNCILANDYVISRQPFQYFFFAVDAARYAHLRGITIEMEVSSGQAELVLNEYMGNGRARVAGGRQRVWFPIHAVEAGENMLAYKGQLQVVDVILEGDAPARAEKEASTAPDDPVAAACDFLLSARIAMPAGSPFHGSCYAIYDYTNGCHRMPCWLWSDAPTVTALLGLIKRGLYPEKKAEMERLARGICDVFLQTQIADAQEETCGAYVSRYRYYGRANRSFHCLLGPNDTSFAVKWAVLPMYEYTGEERYLRSARQALDWVEKVICGMDYVPSHYYFEDKAWEDRAFVDTGFCVEGFAQYDALMHTARYQALIGYAMERFTRQFRLDNGYYGQNYIPGKGADHTLFARGHGWALEGMIAAMRAGCGEPFAQEARRIAALLIDNQNADGSWSWGFGNCWPQDEVKEGTGRCEKGTAVIAYLLLALYRLDGGRDDDLRRAAKRAIAWCEASMDRTPGPGFGGIASQSISSAITGLPFLRVATGYANAFYLLAKELESTM